MGRTATAQILVQQETGLRPPLKWAGGKRWLVPSLRPLWETESRRRLVEPLCGALAVTLGLLPRRALLSDINPHTINFYRWVKKGLVVDITMKNEEQAFYRNRDRFNELVTNGKAQSKEAAELFYYLNRTDYNGLCRFNSRGEFNVPFGRYRTINYTTDFTPYRHALADWEFAQGDFEKLRLKDDDFVYADPPYDVPFTHYSKEGFDWDDQVRLVEWLDRHRGPVVISNQATDRVLKLYNANGYATKLLRAPRMINCTGDRTKAVEVLATKNL